jgi:hypothetical protein
MTIEMAKPRITTDESLDAFFFAELGVDKYDEAMELFCGSSIHKYGALTPRAKEYIMSGEWDENDKISIKVIIDENCRGQIGVTSAGLGGADRFCGKCNELLLLIGSLKSRFQEISRLFKLDLDLLMVLYPYQYSPLYN